ncbi:MAG: hypothetical protein OHK0039_19310 [Bacteroidia bacterium]
MFRYLFFRLNHTRLDPLDRYEETRHRPPGEQEIQWLALVLEKYPYFALAHTLDARWREDDDSRFRAAIYAPNRTLLRLLLAGAPLVDLTPAAAPMEEAHPSARSIDRPQPPLAEFVFSELSPLSRTPMPYESAFGVYAEAANFLPGYAYLNNLVISQTRRGLALIPALRQQLHSYARQAPSRGEVQQAIIDRFLALGRMRAHTTVHTTPDLPEVQHAIEPDEELISETLAQLHLRQNNLDEARRIYSKLRLRFPEKSAYFEAQIEKLTR